MLRFGFLVGLALKTSLNRTGGGDRLGPGEGGFGELLEGLASFTSRVRSSVSVLTRLLPTAVTKRSAVQSTVEYKSCRIRLPAQE